MQVGISTASLFLRKETEDAITTIKSLGAECLEVFLGTYYEYRPEFAKKFASRADFPFVSVHTLPTTFEPQLFNPSRRVRGDAFYWFEQVLRSARLFGAEKYSMHGYIAHLSAGASYDETAGYLREICDFAARYGVDVCLENVCWSTYYRPWLFRELKARCPALAGVLDLKQARRSGYPINAYIEDMRGAISHVHLSDVSENGKTCLPGRGVYDFYEIFSRLADAGFDGPVIIEVYSSDYGDESELETSLGYVKEVIDKLKI